LDHINGTATYLYHRSLIYTSCFLLVTTQPPLLRHPAADRKFGRRRGATRLDPALSSSLRRLKSGSLVGKKKMS